MPSVAQLRGTEIVAEILAPVAGTGLDPSILPKKADTSNPTVKIRECNPINMRAGPTREGAPGVSISVMPHWGRGFAGEYQQVTVLPMDREDPSYPHVHERLAQVIGRWVEIESVGEAYAAEVAACDGDPEGYVMVDDDMPTPASRINCPLVLRAALDASGMPDEDRRVLVDRETSFEFDGWKVQIDSVDTDDRHLWKMVDMPMRSVRRATITGHGMRWSQNMKEHYLDIGQALPQTVRNSIVGLPMRLITDVPWLARVPGITVLKTSTGLNQGVRLGLTRGFAYLGGGHPIIGHDPMRNGEAETERENGKCRT